MDVAIDELQSPALLIDIGRFRSRAAIRRSVLKPTPKRGDLCGMDFDCVANLKRIRSCFTNPAKLAHDQTTLRSKG